MHTKRTTHLPAKHCPHITPLVTVAYEDGQPAGYWATAICDDCGIFASPVFDTIDKVQGWCDAHGYPSRAQAGRKNQNAVALGSMTSAKKAAAARENGRKGGRPPYRYALVVAYSGPMGEKGSIYSRHTTYEHAQAAMHKLRGSASWLKIEEVVR